jgi:hypothetical protein
MLTVTQSKYPWMAAKEGVAKEREEMAATTEEASFKFFTVFSIEVEETCAVKSKLGVA